jgi:hypothetical protein
MIDAEWAQSKAEFVQEFKTVSAFLARYGRGCKRCGTVEAKVYAAYTPETFHFIVTRNHPTWEMIVTGREDFATEYLDRIGAEIYCATCARQTPSNGRWTAIQEARLAESMQKEILNVE